MNAKPKEPVKFPPIQISPQMGDLIREVRLDLGYTQADLAHFAGISQSTLSDIEAGVQTNPRPETLRKIEGPLGFVPGFLAEGFEEERRAAHAPVYCESEDAVARRAEALSDLLAEEKALISENERNLTTHLAEVFDKLRRVTAERDAALKAEHKAAQKLLDTQEKHVVTMMTSPVCSPSRAGRPSSLKDELELILSQAERDQYKIELERVNRVRRVELSHAFWRGAVTGAVAMLAALIISALAVLL